MPALFDPRLRSRLIRLAAVCALILGASEVQAASIVSMSVEATENSSGHSCPCGMDCKGKCCCAGKKSKKTNTPPAPTSTEQPKGEATPPCLDASGCGGGAIPPQAPRGVALGELALFSGDPIVIAVPERSGPTVEARFSLGPVLERLDDPPEALARVR